MPGDEIQYQFRSVFLDKWFPYLVPVSTLLILLFFYGDQVLHPNDYLFNASGDGLKNYFTYSWYLQHNHSLLEFEGMNHPYGEHLFYADAHPGPALLIRGLENFVPALHEYHIGILNMAMLGSYLICAILLYKILHHYQVIPPLAAFASIGITFLAPQAFRMQGHYALSYSLFIPLTWFLLIRYRTGRGTWLMTTMIVLNNFFWFLVHPYLGMILTAFIAGEWIFRILLQKSIRKSWKQLGSGLQVLLPPLLFLIISKLTDHHSHRPDVPWGYFESLASIKSIFLPHHPPFGFLGNILGSESAAWEGWAYVGLSTLIILLSALTSTIISIRRKTTVQFHLPFGLKMFCLSSIVLLLFSMGIPLIWKRDLLEVLPFIAQFRAPGRFAWVFFFAANIAAVVLLNQYLINLLSRKLLAAWFLPALFFLVQFSEGFAHHSDISRSTLNTNQFHENTSELEVALKKIEGKKFQAILPLPYYHIGSENYSREGNEEIHRLSYTLSLATGMPLMSNHLARTSITESRNLMQMMSSPFYKKIIAEDIIDTLPVLIIMLNEGIDQHERELVLRSEILVRSENFSLASIHPDDLTYQSDLGAIEEFKSIETSLKKEGEFLVSDSGSILFYESFEDRKSDRVFRGQGAFFGNAAGYQVLARIATEHLQEGDTVVARFWYYHGLPEEKILADVMVFLQEVKNEKVRWGEVVSTKHSYEISGNWALVEARIVTKEPVSYIELVTRAPDDALRNMILDDVLIYKEGSKIYRVDRKDESGRISLLFRNNHRIMTELSD